MTVVLFQGLFIGDTCEIYQYCQSMLENDPTIYVIRLKMKG